ncbi:MAG: hypothetical protein GY801_49415 [bacterium]|nr:hypothetical protein [bacterium]
MLQSAEKTVISLKPEQRRALREIANQEGQEIDLFIEHVLQDVIENRQGENAAQRNERIRCNFDRIRRHRETFLAKRHNTSLSIDTVELLKQIRDEHDEHAFSLLRSHHR